MPVIEDDAPVTIKCNRCGRAVATTWKEIKETAPKLNGFLVIGPVMCPCGGIAEVDIDNA